MGSTSLIDLPSNPSDLHPRNPLFDISGDPHPLLLLYVQSVVSVFSEWHILAADNAAGRCLVALARSKDVMGGGCCIGGDRSLCPQ